MMPIIEFETRSVQTIKDLPNWDRYFADSKSKSKVTRETASKLSVVYSCVDAIASDISGLPIHLKQKIDGKVRNVTDHPACDKLKTSPNAEMNAFTLRHTRGNHSLLEGNGYIFVERSILNPVKNLWLLDPDAVKVVRSKTKNGRRGVLQYIDQSGYRDRVFQSKDILHLKGSSWNGITGESVVTSKAREVIGIGVEMDEFTSNFFRNGMNPGGIITHPTTFGENKERFIAALKKRYLGNAKSRMPMVLENDVKYTPYEVKMVDQQFLEMMKLNKVDICGMFGVPQSRISISDSNTNYNNSEQENRRYVRSGLLKWAIQDEQEMNLKLLTQEQRNSGYYFKYNFGALSRGESKDRAEVYEKFWRMGVPTNRFLELEDENPIDGGEIGRVQLNTIPINEANNPPEPEQNSRANEREYRDVKKTIAQRLRTQKRFSPLIRDAAQKLVNREAIAIKRESKKQSGERADSDMSTWLDSFYSDFGKYIDKELAPILRAYAEAIQEAVAGEVGVDIGVSEELEMEINSYIDGLSNGYINSSKRQMLGQLQIGLDAIDTRAEEWEEKKAGKLEMRESSGLSNMVASFVIAGVGLSPIWRNVGPTCKFCKQMHGKKIKRYGDSFLKKDTVLNAEIEGVPREMKVRTTKYPPLHGGCDCVISSR